MIKAYESRQTRFYFYIVVIFTKNRTIFPKVLQNCLGNQLLIYLFTISCIFVFSLFFSFKTVFLARFKQVFHNFSDITFIWGWRGGG